MRVPLPTALLVAALAGGCAGTVGYSGTVSNAGYYGDPDLVYVSPGVQVIADWNEPIFFTNGFYWRYDGLSWYRSSYYAGGWVYAAPPMALIRIDRPYAYRHYRPTGWTPRNQRFDRGPVVRDHRTAPPARWQPPPRRVEQPRSAPPPPPARYAPPPARHAPPPARQGPPQGRQGPPPAPTTSRDHRDRDHD